VINGRLTRAANVAKWIWLKTVGGV